MWLFHIFPLFDGDLAFTVGSGSPVVLTIFISIQDRPPLYWRSWILHDRPLFRRPYLCPWSGVVLTTVTILFSIKDLTLYGRSSPLFKIAHSTGDTRFSRIAHCDGDVNSIQNLMLVLISIQECQLYQRSGPIQDRPLSMVISSQPRISRCTGDPHLYPGLTKGCWRSSHCPESPICKCTGDPSWDLPLYRRPTPPSMIAHCTYDPCVSVQDRHSYWYNILTFIFTTQASQNATYRSWLLLFGYSFLCYNPAPGSQPPS